MKQQQAEMERMMKKQQENPWDVDFKEDKAQGEEIELKAYT